VSDVTSLTSFKFIDLFSGVGGFHIALRSLGGTCVLACDIDKACREVYEANYGIRPHDDVTKLDTADIPDFDVLCAGFPCQAFSHAGRQEGFADIRGTLFMDVVRILRDKKPRFFLLENVKNLTSHDNGNTWNVIHRHLTMAGYTTPSTEFNQYKKKFGANPYVYSWDLAGYSTLQFPEQNVFALAGFSDKVFDIMKMMELDKKALFNEIKAIQL
jgi:site-specific DNA-cytosine methylase